MYDYSADLAPSHSLENSHATQSYILIIKEENRDPFPLCIRKPAAAICKVPSFWPGKIATALKIWLGTEFCDAHMGTNETLVVSIGKKKF